MIGFEVGIGKGRLGVVEKSREIRLGEDGMFMPLSWRAFMRSAMLPPGLSSGELLECLKSDINHHGH